MGLFFVNVKGLKDSTKNHYLKKLTETLGTPLGAEPVSRLTPDRMKAYLHERRGKTSDIQIRHELTAISSVLEWAVEWGVPGAPEINPVKMTRKKGLAKPVSRPRAIGPDDVSRLLAEAHRTSPEFWEPFLTLILETGMRHEEALGLSWGEVDFVRGVINLRWQREKAGRGRVIPLSNTAANTLGRVRRFPSSDFVFTNPRTRRRYSSIWKGWGRLRDKVNLSTVRIHDFRHTFASYCRRLGMDRLDRKAIMGHSSEEAHELYAGSNETALRDVMNKYSPSTLLTQERELAKAKAKGEKTE